MNRSTHFLATAVLPVLSLWLIGLSAGVWLWSCASAPPVPVVGARGDLEALVGRWEGMYSSPSTQRAGTITFVLKADADTARGEVTMVPSGWGRPAADEEKRRSEGRSDRLQSLKIHLVRVEGDRLRGTLEPYLDPACGCRLETTFEGHVHADTLEGIFTSLAPASGDVHRGQWRLLRR